MFVIKIFERKITMTPNIEKFKEKNNFKLWRIRMRILI